MKLLLLILSQSYLLLRRVFSEPLVSFSLDHLSTSRLFFSTYILGIVLHNTHLPLYTVVVFVQYTIPSVQHCQSGHLHIHLESEHANHRTMVQHEAKCSDCWSVLLGSHGMKLWHWIWCQKKSVLQVKRFP